MKSENIQENQDPGEALLQNMASTANLSSSSPVIHLPLDVGVGGTLLARAPMDICVGGTLLARAPMDICVGGTLQATGERNNHFPPLVVPPNFSVGGTPISRGQDLGNFDQNVDVAGGRGEGSFSAGNHGGAHFSAGGTKGKRTGGVDTGLNVSVVEGKTEPYTTKSPFEAKPRNRKEAQASNYWPQYLDAEFEEMSNHQENGTWKLVPLKSIPKGAKILRTKWVYDDKKGLDGEIVRFKARLTAMGNFQREGVDYFDTYASVMRTKSLRVLLQLLNASADHKMEHWDIKAAFINAPLEEDIWIYQPDGHHQVGSEGMICKLNKALYGLKQAGRAWQKLLKSILSEVGFTQLLKDEGVFVARSPEGGWCVIGTHVDDLFPLYNVKGRILRDKVFAALGKRVKVKNEGDIKWALKIQIERDVERGIMKISQGQFVREILQRFGFDGVYDEHTPAYDQGPNSVMDEEDISLTQEEIALLHATYAFYEAIGCLWWLANISRQIFISPYSKPHSMFPGRRKVMVMDIKDIQIFVGGQGQRAGVLSSWIRRRGEVCAS